MPTPTGMKYHSVLDLPSAIRNREENLGRWPECWEYDRRPPPLATCWRFKE